MSSSLASRVTLSGLLLLAVVTVGPGCAGRWPWNAPKPSAELPLPPGTSPESAPAPTSTGSPIPSSSAPRTSPPLTPTPSTAAAAMPARLGPGAPGGNGASSQCLAQIETFAERHSGNRVMLGQAAFAEGDQLVLSRVPRRAADRTLLDGRMSAEQPVILNLRGGPQGCSVHLAAAAGPLPASAPLPACTCVPLSR
jgi:hypothetical protein